MEAGREKEAAQSQGPGDAAVELRSPLDEQPSIVDTETLPSAIESELRLKDAEIENLQLRIKELEQFHTQSNEDLQAESKTRDEEIQALQQKLQASQDTKAQDKEKAGVIVQAMEAEIAEIKQSIN